MQSTPKFSRPDLAFFGPAIAFVVIGLTTKNYAFIGVGAAFFALGMARWRKNRDGNPPPDDPGAPLA